MTALLSRFGSAAVILAGVSFLTFVLAYVIPADPALTFAGPKADKETLERIRHETGLDQPLLVQYARYMSRLAHGDLGRSYVTRQTVRDAIAERLAATGLLALSALAFAVGIGVVIGSWTATRAGQGIDVGVLIVSLLCLSLPVFWLGLILLYVFGYWLRVLPLGGFSSPLHVVLPAVTLGLGTGAYYARLVHTNVREAMRSDYIRTAQAKGVPPVLVYGKHALRNALLPLTTLVGLDLAGLLSGVVLTETVFNWPGLGRLAVEAVFNQDIPMILGTVLFSAALVVGANILVDLLYVVIDPRIRIR